MKELKLDIHGIETTIYKMRVKPAHTLFNELMEIASTAFKGASTEMDMIASCLNILGNRDNIKIYEKMITSIFVDGKQVNSLDQLETRIEDRVDVWVYLDDILLDFIKFQFENRFNNLKKKLGLEGNFSLTGLMSNQNSTPESGES
jgi:hypothetical protein